MTKTAKLFVTGGSQAVRLPREFRFPGQTVLVRRTPKGVLLMPNSDMEARRRAFIKLAGSCRDLPDVPSHSAVDVARDYS